MENEVWTEHIIHRIENVPLVNKYILKICLKILQLEKKSEKKMD